VNAIDAYRTGKGTFQSGKQISPDRVFENLDEALAAHPDIVVVSNPTVLHVPTALAAVRAGSHVLVEKPLSNSLSGCSELAEEVQKRGVSLSIACNVRFHPALRKVREIVLSQTPLGDPITARMHFGTYLPEWHPWEDFRLSYASRGDLGGGASLTNIHEIDYALWLFGRAEESTGIPLSRHPLGTNVDEACSILIRHCSGVLSTITLSLAQRPASRTLEVSFTEGTIACDLMTGSMVTRYANGLVETEIPERFDWDETYKAQASHFINTALGKCPPMVPIEDGISALKVALSSHRSAVHV
jgi:predicted dehydrogenase